MGSRPALVGMEVPITGTDSVKWLDLELPSTSTSTPATAIATPSVEDRASCSAIGDPPHYIIWRIHKHAPRTLELLEFSTHKEFPRVGLRIAFPDLLFPFAFICQNEIDSSPVNPYLLYVMTVSGVAFLLRLRNVSAYSSCAVFPHDEVIECDLRDYFDNVMVNCVAATVGCLVVGRNDGLATCFRLGLLDHNAPGFVHELRDDSGIGRLWGFMSRGRMAGPVQDMVITRIRGPKVLFLLHSDGILQAWDLSNYSKILSHTIGIPNLEGATPMRLWMGEANRDSSKLPVAILYRHALEISLEMIYVFNLHFSMADRIVLSVEFSTQTCPLDDGGCIEVKLSSDKMWILKDNGLFVYDLFHINSQLDVGQSYALQEEFVAEQLFQSLGLSADGLLCIVHSTFSSAKDQIVPFLSSIFLRRLLHPGVYHEIAMRSTLLDYNRHWSDTEFQSLTFDGLEKEIYSLIEREGASTNPTSIFCNWKNFCRCYFHHWCKNNSPCGLLVHSSAGAVGLVRKNSVSVFRDLEGIERLIDGVSDETFDLINIGSDLSDDNLEREILVGVLRCVVNMSQQLGKMASAIFYESLVGVPVALSEDIVPCLLKILETGCISSASCLGLSEIGGDFAWEKELSNHKNLRKFSIDMLLSLNKLSRKATSWSKVLSAIEGHVQFLVPQKVIQKLDAQISYNINTSILVQATSQIAKLMFESSLDILLFVSYLCTIGRQINMMDGDISRIQMEMVPMIQDIVFEWLIIYFLNAAPSDPLAFDDFSSQLSSLQIDSTPDRRSWKERLGKCDFPLAFILLLATQMSTEHQNHLSSYSFLTPENSIILVRDFTSWIVWGKTGDESCSFVKRAIELSLILLRHGQYNAVEHLLTIVEANSQMEKTFKSIQDRDGYWCVLQHLLGCCLLAQARHELHGILKEKKAGEAIRRFFRASSGQCASEALQSLSRDAGLPHLGFDGCLLTAAWKLHYYQWAMQIFEQYDISGGACQFALAALEQVDEALIQNDGPNQEDTCSESVTSIKGRLWANVFKFMLDQNHLHDAYCAILSNPDDESKYICLRRFIIVLYERGAAKVLCDGQLPFIGLAEKIEQELAWKAERSDVLAKPNPYKFLYAFEMRQHNWRKAATYMYQYSTRLRIEVSLKDQQHRSAVLQERINGLSAAINALHLVQPANAWIGPLPERNSLSGEYYPCKKSKMAAPEQVSHSDIQLQHLQHYVDVADLENEFVLTSAEYLLSLASVRWAYTADKTPWPPSDLVDLLVEANLYDMAFTIVLKFWKGSAMVRELERAFSAMSLRCCPNKASSLSTGTHGLLLTSSMGEMVVHGSPEAVPASQQSKGNTQWETLEHYLEKYKSFHAGLPSIVAETLLRTDSQIELPLWLVHMFKDGQRDRTWGMTGQESNPASLFRLYVNYGRYTEATNLLLEYTESYVSVRPSELFHRKKAFAAWFPYTVIERLWCQLEELINSGHMVDQHDKLKRLIYGALEKHLKLVKVDSEDAISSATC